MTERHGGRSHGSEPGAAQAGSSGAVRAGDPRLQDPQALDEIELYGEVLIAASQSEGPLSTDEIDAALGLRSGQRG